MGQATKPVMGRTEGITMPKASVRNADYHYEPVLTEGSGEWKPTRGKSKFAPSVRMGVLEIGWSKYPTGMVEIATVDEGRIEDIAAEMELAADRGEDPIEVFRRIFSTSPGLWFTLSWDGVNQAMAKLRIARDQAFGKPQ